MKFNHLVLLFLIMVFSNGEHLAARENVESALDAFNEELEREAEMKIEKAHQAEKEGNIREAQMLYREALMLASLKVEEGRLSEARLLSMKDSMPRDEKKDWIERFMREGNRLARLGLYDLAVDEYEKVFLLEPTNVKASQKIDQLKKRFLKEEKQAFEEQGKRIEEELQHRIEIYLTRAEELIQLKDYGSARRLLEQMLVLDPKNKRAKRLLKKTSEE